MTGSRRRREREFRKAHAAARDAVHMPSDRDLGRRLADDSSLPRTGDDQAVVIGDGLPPRAVHSALVTALLERLEGWSVAPVVLAHQARGGRGDAVGAGLGVRAVVVLIGERPGLSSADFLGAYLPGTPARGGWTRSAPASPPSARPPGWVTTGRPRPSPRFWPAPRSLGASGVAVEDETALPG